MEYTFIHIHRLPELARDGSAIGVMHRSVETTDPSIEINCILLQAHGENWLVCGEQTYRLNLSPKLPVACVINLFAMIESMPDINTEWILEDRPNVLDEIHKFVASLGD